MKRIGDEWRMVSPYQRQREMRSGGNRRGGEWRKKSIISMASWRQMMKSGGENDVAKIGEKRRKSVETENNGNGGDMRHRRAIATRHQCCAARQHGARNRNVNAAPRTRVWRCAHHIAKCAKQTRGAKRAPLHRASRAYRRAAQA